MKMLVVAAIFTLMAIVAASRLTPKRSVAWLLAGAMDFSLFLLGLYYFSDQFTGSGIDESVVFHLMADKQGADLMEFWPQFLGIGVFLLFLVWVTWFTARRSKAPGLQKTKPLRMGLVSLLLLASVSINPATRDLWELHKTGHLFSLFFETQSTAAVQPAGVVVPQTIELPNKPSFIYVYLESLERSYLDESHFPGLTPNLKRLEREALSFSRIGQARNTGWTMAGMVASQCGIPLTTPSHENSLNGLIGQFLPKATCLGDLLNAQGYHLEYVGGADLAFAGKGSFFQSHGFHEVMGRQELSRKLNDPSRMHGWGFYDDVVFEVAQERLSELVKHDRPFGLFMLTLDTHHPSGYVSKLCQASHYGDGKNPILNAVHCSDELVGRFVDFVRSHEAYKNVKIILASDHLAMPNTARERLEKIKRRSNTFMVLSADIEPRQISRPGTTLDIAPTLLSLFGSNIESLGFGRNLLNDKLPSVQAETGLTLRENIIRATPWLHSLWRYPNVAEGFEVDLKNKILRFEGQEAYFPALIALNEDNSTKSIIFDFDASGSLLGRARKLGINQKIMWIDRCQKIDVQGRAWLLNDYCLLFGRIGEKSMNAVKIDDGQIIEGSGVYFKNVGGVKGVDYKNNLAILSMLERFNTPNVFYVDLDKNNPNQSAVKSLSVNKNPSLLSSVDHVFLSQAFWGLGRSQAYSVKRKDSMISSFKRGLTLLGIDDKGNPIKLAHMDTCAQEVIDEDVPHQNIAEAFRATQNSFVAHVVLANDSAMCSKSLSEQLQGLPLNKLDEVKVRTPYIAMLINGHPVFEQVGEREQSLALAVSGLERLRSQR